MMVQMFVRVIRFIRFFKNFEIFRKRIRMDQWKVLSIGSVLVVWDIATSEQLVNFDEKFNVSR